MAALLTSSTPSAQVRLETAGALLCPNRAQLDRALRLRFDSVTTSTETPARAVIRARPSGAELVLELANGGAPPVVRRLSRDGASCEALADTVAWIADAWSRKLPWREHHRAADGPPAARASGSKPVARSTETPIAPVREPETAAVVEERTERAVDPPTPALQPTPAVPAPAAPASPPSEPPPRAEVETVAAAADPPSPPLASSEHEPGGAIEAEVPAPEPSHASLWSLEVLGGAGLSLDADRAARAVGELGVDFSLTPRFGVGARGGVSSPATITSAFGSVRLYRVPLALYGRWQLHDPDESGFSLRAGLSLDVLHARSHGFTVDGAVTVVAPALFAAARGELRLTPYLGLFAELVCTVAALGDSFQVDALGEVATAGRVNARAAAGLAVHFF
jgi:hypothetical protein